MHRQRRPLHPLCLVLGLTAAHLAAQDPTPVATDDAAQPAFAVRGGAMVSSPISAITELHNTMSQELEGIGLVTGLNTTGSSEKATRDALASYIRRHRININQTDLTSGSVAMVRVTGRLEPFAVEGSRFGVKVSLTGDALSLYGGDLVFCELMGIDGQVYATASGPVLAGGVAAAGDNQRESRNHPTTGWVENGAQVVRELPWTFFSEAGDLELRLKNPTPHNALAVATGCRKALADLGYAVEPVHNSVVKIKIPAERRTPADAMEILARVRAVEVAVEHPTKVVIDSGTGAVVAGGGVRISPCAVSLAELTINVTNDDEISQPFPGFNNGRTERVSRSRVEIIESGNEPQKIGGNGATAEDLIENLRALSLTPQQVVTVFRLLHSSGYLHADLVVR